VSAAGSLLSLKDGAPTADRAPIRPAGSSLTFGDVQWKCGRVESIEWWDTLDAASKDWLIQHNGEALSSDVLAKITAAGGDIASDAWWIGEEGPDGFYLSDEAVDWIEGVGNAE
jgi:hypothetical protein